MDRNNTSIFIHGETKYDIWWTWQNIYICSAIFGRWKNIVAIFTLKIAKIGENPGRISENFNYIVLICFNLLYITNFKSYRKERRFGLKYENIDLSNIVEFSKIEQFADDNVVKIKGKTLGDAIEKDNFDLSKYVNDIKKWN